jgi:hypothetical protein
VRGGLAVLAAGLLVLLIVAVVVARAAPRRPASTTTPPKPAAPTLAVPTVATAPTLPTAACHYRAGASAALLPDRDCTPGAANPELTRDVLCAAGFDTRRYRRVSDAQKRAAFARYGIASHAAGEYEIDHLVALEDGGSNEAANLWPQPARPQPGFHEKDLVETYIHRQVCAGTLDLADGQQRIASDWTALLEVAARAGLPAKSHSDDGDELD